MITSAAIAVLVVCCAGLAVALVWQRRVYERRLEEGNRRVRELVANPLLTGVHIGNGTIDIGLEGPGPTLLAGMFIGMFEKYPDAKNYLECHMSSSKGDIIVTVRRRDGKTPDALKRETEARLSAALEKTRSASSKIGQAMDRLDQLATGGCTCLVKSPKLEEHHGGCNYRLTGEAQQLLLGASEELRLAG